MPEEEAALISRFDERCFDMGDIRQQPMRQNIEHIGYLSLALLTYMLESITSRIHIYRLPYADGVP